MSQLSTRSIRLLLDAKTPQDRADQLTSEIVRFICGDDIVLQIGLAYNNLILTDLSNLFDFHLEIRDDNDPTTSPLISITKLPIDLEACTQTGWDGGTQQNFTVALTQDVTNLTSGNKWFTAWVNTTATIQFPLGQRITVGYGIVNFLQDGAGGDVVPQALGANYWTKAESDARYVGGTKGRIALTPGQVTCAIPFTFLTPPSEVVAQILVPTGGDNIFCVIEAPSITTTSATANFTAPITGAGYFLQWRASL